MKVYMKTKENVHFKHYISLSRKRHRGILEHQQLGIAAVCLTSAHKDAYKWPGHSVI